MKRSLHALPVLLAGAGMLACILLVAEHHYQRSFAEALEDLQEQSGRAHLEHDLTLKFSRYGERTEHGRVSLAEDAFESARIRLPWFVAESGRLGRYWKESPWTIFSYCHVTVGFDDRFGDSQFLHSFIWSPRERQFRFFQGRCSRPGCPAYVGE